MNRKQFARTVAEAYSEQYHDGSRVMNNPIITWDGEEFGWQSSLTPLNEDEVQVMEIEDGCFGDIPSDRTTKQAYSDIYDYLTDSAYDDNWLTVTAEL